MLWTEVRRSQTRRWLLTQASENASLFALESSDITDTAILVKFLEDLPTHGVHLEVWKCWLIHCQPPDSAQQASDLSM